LNKNEKVRLQGRDPMINFELTEDHFNVENLVKSFVTNEISPTIAENDANHHFDRAILKKMADLGLLGICIPPAYGGAGFDYISLGLACEELEFGDTSCRVILSVHLALNGMTLLSWGTEDQKRRYLIPQSKGQEIASFGMTEPDAGSDVVGLQSTAIRNGQEYILNGEKTWISLADVADNFLVIAWTDLDKKKNRDHSGLSSFIVERTRSGFASGTLKQKWGIRAGNTGFFSMNDVHIPAANRVGEEGEGFKIAMFALEQGRYTVAAGATGLIKACLEASKKYSLERKAFGKPISEHQLVKEMIAQMVLDYEASRLLWLRCGWMKNLGRQNNRETSLAKWYATVASERAASDAVQIHGAYGYSDEYPVGRFFRNSKGAVIYEGTKEIHKLLQADYALGYRKDRPRRCNLPPFVES
jgi:glutaryl-CoA dehydrogenase (non-decarboxylating)